MELIRAKLAFFGISHKDIQGFLNRYGLSATAPQISNTLMKKETGKKNDTIRHYIEKMLTEEEQKRGYTIKIERIR